MMTKQSSYGQVSLVKTGWSSTAISQRSHDHTSYWETETIERGYMTVGLRHIRMYLSIDMCICRNCRGIVDYCICKVCKQLTSGKKVHSTRNNLCVIVGCTEKTEWLLFAIPFPSPLLDWHMIGNILYLFIYIMCIYIYIIIYNTYIYIYMYACMHACM